jgi:hypothetical protein
MKNPNVYAAFVVILPVSLGLGLVYLTIVGRIDAGAAIAVALGLAALVGLLVFVRDFASNQETYGFRGSRR